MEESLYKSYKAELEAKLEAYYQSADLFKVIELLENSELDFDLCMELVRTYINVANKSGDPYTLQDETIPDGFSIRVIFCTDRDLLRML